MRAVSVLLRILSSCAAAGVAALVALPAVAAPINLVSYASLTVTGLEDFESTGAGPFPGTNIDGVLDLDGTSYAERFAGQALVTVGTFDTLSGLPSGPLSLTPGAALQNLVVANSGGVGIGGLGPLGFPDLSANGEGALSILLDIDSPEFGIEIRGSQGGSATLDFFRRDGSLIDSVTLAAVADGFFGFERDGATVDIAGISITNTDLQGIGYDNVRFQVPEPSIAVLLALGLVAAGYAPGRRRRRSIDRV